MLKNECEVLELLKEMTSWHAKKHICALQLYCVGVENRESMGLYFLLKVKENAVLIFSMLITRKKYKHIYAENIFC